MSRSLHELQVALTSVAERGAPSLEAFVNNWTADETLVDQLIAIAETGEQLPQRTALALLKRYAARGWLFTAESSRRLLQLLPSLTDWRATVNLLQFLPRLAVPPESAEDLCDALFSLTANRNNFVRAWAYSGLHQLAAIHPAYRAETREILARAARLESASVRARIRQLEPLG